MKKLIKSAIFTVILCLFCSFNVFAASQSNSGKTAADIITEARQILNESVASFWTDAMMLDWIDAATKEIVAKTKCRQDIATITLVTGTMEYAWTGDSEYIQIMACMYHDGTEYKSLTKTDIKSIGRISATGSPKYWYEWEDQVGIWPIPTAAYNAQKVYAYYVIVPVVIDGTTDNILTPAIFDDALVWYTVGHAKMRDNKPEEAAYYMNLFNEIIALYRQDILYSPKESVNEATP